jgi:hypothetical protein
VHNSERDSCAHEHTSASVSIALASCPCLAIKRTTLISEQLGPVVCKQWPILTSALQSPIEIPLCWDGSRGPAEACVNDLRLAYLRILRI